MKRWLTLVLLLGVTWVGTSRAGQTAVAVGAFGGLSTTILQDVNVDDISFSDAFQSGGSQFGIRVPVKAVSLVTFEAYYAKASYSDVEETFNGIGYTRDGYDTSSFGVNFIFGDVMSSSFKFYPYVGLGKTKIEREGEEEIDDLQWNFGLGVGFPVMPKLSLHVRTEFDMVKTDDTSRKFGHVQLGAHYNLLP